VEVGAAHRAGALTRGRGDATAAQARDARASLSAKHRTPAFSCRTAGGVAWTHLSKAATSNTQRSLKRMRFT